MCRRGQILTTDFFLALLVFLIILGALIISWNHIADSAGLDIERKNMELTALRTIDILVKNDLVYADRTIDENKLQTFLNTNYNTTKDVMGIPYEYFFDFMNNNITKGYLGGDTRVTVKRAVVYKNRGDVIEITIWK